MFLATPHRGSNFAQILQNMLRVSPIHSTKGYLVDLAKGSVTLQGINEDFRHVASDYRLVSFYESLETRIGPTTIVNGPATSRPVRALELTVPDT